MFLLPPVLLLPESPPAETAFVSPDGPPSADELPLPLTLLPFDVADPLADDLQNAMTLQVGAEEFDDWSIEPPDPPAPPFPPLPPSDEASLPLLWFFWIVSATLPPVCDAEFPELAVLPLSLVIEVGSHVLKLLALVLVVVWSQLPNWQ